MVVERVNKRESFRWVLFFIHPALSKIVLECLSFIISVLMDAIHLCAHGYESLRESKVGNITRDPHHKNFVFFKTRKLCHQIANKIASGVKRLFHRDTLIFFLTCALLGMLHNFGEHNNQSYTPINNSPLPIHC